MNPRRGGKRRRPEPLVIAGEAIARGETREIMLPFAESYLGHIEAIPTYVQRAKEPGPRVFIAGALHGDELNGLGIVRELLYGKPPPLLRGTLILMPVLNIDGLERHTRYMQDRRDPNRCFPGTPYGSRASRFAHAVFTEVVRQCDYGIDFHSAAIRRTNYPNVRAWLRDPGTKRLAQAFGCELIVNSRGPAGSLRRSAVGEGVPTIILEAGEVWKIEPGVVDIGVRGTLNVLKSLGMLEGEPERPACQVTVTRTTWVRSEIGGVLGFNATPGKLVRQNEWLATVHSLFGIEQTSLISPVDGIVLGMGTMPFVKPGGPVYHIGVLSKRQFDQALRDRLKRLPGDPFRRIEDDLATNVTLHEH
jgi:predicted deacylase